MAWILTQFRVFVFSFCKQKYDTILQIVEENIDSIQTQQSFVLCKYFVVSKWQEKAS